MLPQYSRDYRPFSLLFTLDCEMPKVKRLVRKRRSGRGAQAAFRLPSSYRMEGNCATELSLPGGIHPSGNCNFTIANIFGDVTGASQRTMVVKRARFTFGPFQSTGTSNVTMQIFAYSVALSSPVPLCEPFQLSEVNPVTRNVVVPVWLLGPVIPATTVHVFECLAASTGTAAGPSAISVLCKAWADVSKPTTNIF